jgi:predicted O-methyltransferase YrrM
MLAVRAARLVRHDSSVAQAIGRAQRDTARGRFSTAEWAWIERIEARRARLAAEHGQSRSRLWSPPCAWSLPRVWGRFLFRLIRELRPESCLELGVGFGVSALYQASALELNDHGRLHSLDREPSLIAVAEQGFAELDLERRIELTRGPIGQTLPGVAASEATIDYALIDAEHTESATVGNFDVLRPHLTPGAVVVVDDILSTAEMERAWTQIRRRRGVELALNLRRVGIVVVGTEPA